MNAPLHVVQPDEPTPSVALRYAELLQAAHRETLDAIAYLTEGARRVLDCTNPATPPLIDPGAYEALRRLGEHNIRTLDNIRRMIDR